MIALLLLALLLPSVALATDPCSGTVWSLVTKTYNGHVSILKKLTKREAEGVIRAITPEWNKPFEIRTDCITSSDRMTVCGGHIDNDALELIEPIGPDGCELDPWSVAIKEHADLWKSQLRWSSEHNYNEAIPQ